ncbi:MAG: DUF2837 family protein [Sediminibacterium sp.]|nr:DUF2837 family protein [Sediminibacterium sp.]
MKEHLVLVCGLTILIHFIGIISLAARIVGTRTHKLGTTLSLFNLISVISNVANTLQAPLLTKSIEHSINLGITPEIINFRYIIFCATIGTILGAIAIPTVHRFMEKGVLILYSKGSVFSVFASAFRVKTFTHFIKSCTIPRLENIYRLKRFKDLNRTIIFLNVLVYAFLTVSVVSCLYAGCLNPNYRTTSLSLSGIAVGIGSLCFIVFIEPYNYSLTDKVIDGAETESFFRRHIVYVVVARITGTIMGQLLFLPLSIFISYISKII